MSDSKFEIVDGVLKKYTGTDKKVIIPEGVIAIKDNCFTDAHFMEEITFPSTLRKIGYSIVATDYYGYEYALKRVNIDSLDTWMNIDFTDNKANLLGVSDEVELYIGGQLVTDLVIPGKYKTVKANSFFGYKKLKTVVFEEGVETIEKSAFVRSGITKVTLPNSIKDLIGQRFGHFFSSPFQYCKDLKEINIPKGLKVLPDYFLDGSAIENIELPDGLEVISSGCFNNCKQLKAINIPSSVHTVKENAFYGVDSMEELIFPDSVYSIGRMSFSNIKRIVLPEDWNYIGNKYWSLIEYSKLDKLEMNEYDNALYIGSRTNPYQVLVSAKSKDISSCIIHKDCKYICAAGSYTYGNMGFYECKNLKSIAIPKGIKRIEFSAFAKCDSLESIELPSGFGVLDEKVYEGSPNVKIKEHGLKDKVIHFENSISKDDETIKEEFDISHDGINLIATRTFSNGDVITTRFKKKNKISSERLIAIFSTLGKANEMKEEDYLNNPDVYKVSYPIHDNENVSKYILFNEGIIKLVYSLFNSFIGEYFLLNAHYKDILSVTGLFSHYSDAKLIRDEIESNYENYNLEQLGSLLEDAKNKDDYLTYEKISLYMYKVKNGGWNENYGEE